VERVDPSYARKLLRDAAAWAAATHGIAPHRDFAVAERLFGGVSADACDVPFRFGPLALVESAASARAGLRLPNALPTSDSTGEVEQ
jgi:hypothetical protein